MIDFLSTCCAHILLKAFVATTFVGWSYCTGLQFPPSGGQLSDVRWRADVTLRDEKVVQPRPNFAAEKSSSGGRLFTSDGNWKLILLHLWFPVSAELRAE